MTNHVDEAIKKVLVWLADDGALDESSVLLIGSAARSVARPDSDIDIVVITDNPPPTLPERSYDVHLILMRRDEFLRRARDRDDFPLWVLCYGKVISDSPGWVNLMRRKKESFRWPLSKPKRRQAQRRIAVARAALASGDSVAAREELFYAFSHLARSVLISRRVLPGARPELVAQLRKVGARALADQLDLLASEQELSDEELSAIASHNLDADLAA